MKWGYSGPAFFAAMVIFVPMAMAACPHDNTYINSSTVLSGGICQVNDTDRNGVLIINNNSVVLDCNGTTLRGAPVSFTPTIAIRNPGFSNVTIRGCIVTSYYESVNVSQSRGTTIFNNTLNMTLVALGVQRSNATNITGNSIRTVPLFGVGILLMNSTRTRIMNNTMNPWLASLIGIFSYGSNNSLVKGNTMSRVSIGFYDLYDQGSKYSHNRVNISSYGFMIGHSRGLDLSSNNITALMDLVLMNSTGITLPSYKTLIVSWPLRVRVVNESGMPVQGAFVRVFNSTGQAYANGTTSANGIAEIPVLERMENGTSIRRFNPHLVNVTKAGYYHNSTRINVTGFAFASLALKKQQYADTQKPLITEVSATSNTSFVNGTRVSIRASVTDNAAVDRVWVVIDYPGAGEDRIALANNVVSNYVIRKVGRHNVTFYANDTSGNAANTTTISFVSARGITLASNVTGHNSSGLKSSIEIYRANSTELLAQFNSTNGAFSMLVPNGTDDVSFSAFGGMLHATLEDVRLWLNTNRRMRMDRLPSPVSGFKATYAVESTYSFARALVRIFYNASAMENENSLGLYACHGWDIQMRSCNGTWTRLNATLSTGGNYIEAYVTGFSAFSVKQEPYCGDGACGAGETASSCSADCHCTPGLSRRCSASKFGRCAAGNESCVNGAWTGCPLAIAETCNQVDDNCDGIVDNVGGGQSEDQTQCGCYRGARPSPEIFDGVDNDCNGLIDDGCVCNETETKECGSGIGACRKGVQTCSNCKWSECEGGTGPFEEVCGNNNDDDCDGQVDESECIIETNQTCGYGPIPSSGCKCGSGTYASGNCCNGEYGLEPCAGFPWWILVAAGVAILAGVLGYNFLKKRKTPEEKWGELEKAYSPASM